jgi:heterodisulfide reductase subunit C2
LQETLSEGNLETLLFLHEVEAVSGQSVSTCFQCYKCTSGCPVAMDMDVHPHRLIRSVILGERKAVLRARTMWICLQCMTCTIRCPNGIDIARVFEALRGLSAREGEDAEGATWLFDTIFLKSVEARGRLYEFGTSLLFKMKKGGLLHDGPMGLAMLAKNRLGLFPHGIRDKAGLRAMLGRVKARKSGQETDNRPEAPVAPRGR